MGMPKTLWHRDFRETGPWRASESPGNEVSYRLSDCWLLTGNEVEVRGFARHLQRRWEMSGGCRVTGKRVFVSRTICISYSHGMERGRRGAERIHAWRSGRGSSVGHFKVFGISLIWSSGFGIWKQNRGEIRYWKLAREVGRQKQPSGLRDCTKFKVRITGLKDPIRDPPGRQLDEGATPQGSTRYSFIYHFWQKRYPLGARSVPTFPDRTRPIFPWPCLRDAPTSTG